MLNAAETLKWSRFKPEFLNNFIEEPYVIEPFRIDKAGKVIEWKVYVPKMVEFQVGRLERATHSYNVFVVNQYMRWFAEIPQELVDRFPQVKVELQVSDGLLLTDIGEEDRTYTKYRKFLLKRKGPGAIQIKKGSEWELIAKILEDGCLPFVPHAPSPEDFRSPSTTGFALNPKWKIRNYQKKALKLFMKYGAIGIYWPFGTGKSQFGIQLCDTLKGHKLIIAGGSSALREQWNTRLRSMTASRRSECHVVVYQSKKEIERLQRKYKTFSLILFDECLPYEENVYTEYGPIPIGYLVEHRIQCNVWSYNFSTRQLELKPIIHHFTKYTNSLLELETEYNRVKVTPTHPIFLNNGKHLPAKQLQVSDSIVCMRNMWKRIREKAGLRGSYHASQTSRTQQENIPRASLESKASRTVGSLQEEISRRTHTRGKPELERWDSSADLAKDSIHRLQVTYGMYGLSRSFVGNSVGYSSQGRGSLQQLERKSYGTLSFMSRKPTPRGWSHYTEMDSISRIREIEVTNPLVYDIEVADNHNFFANGVLVSNCHHLPAKTFMRLSTIPTKYRLGLTGSPYREDGHINYIIALTGYPHGLAWSEFVTEGIITLAQIQIHVVKKKRDKLHILDQLLKRDLGKTLIFCDSLDLGDSIAKKYDYPWIHGGTTKQIETVERNQRVVISRVGDEGISVPTIDTIVEIDFLGGSRAQALQRVGRLQHRLLKPDQEPAVHHILMTEEEVEKYGKRLLAYYDKGFRVDWLYNF